MISISLKRVIAMQLVPMLAFVTSACGAEDYPLGYDDTPVIPGQKWKVHDIDRPHPPKVEAGETFSHEAPAPADATVLFDGSDLSKWERDNGRAAGWKVQDGYMEVVKDAGSIRTKEEFEDFQLHLEWATPTQIVARSQGRGNSGVIIHGQFEVQVLDSYTNVTYADGQAGAMYGQWPPLVNASKPPGEWQSYDIIFEAPRWNELGELTRKAAVTVIHNGVVLHHRKEFRSPVAHRELGEYRRYSSKGKINLQDHGNPIRYRNIWIRPLREYDRE